MFLRNVLFAVIIIALLFSCTVNKPYDPLKKFPKTELQQDYTLLKEILETKHPSLYWYTSKDSMDKYFDSYYQSITDSMTELQFAWQILSPLVHHIRCGHTSVGMSKNYLKKMQNKRLPSFPLYMKIWGDSMAVTRNMNPKDSVIKRGTIITSVNSIPANSLIDQMFGYLSCDGYAENSSYIRLSGNFPFYHRVIYGTSEKYAVGYIDEDGNSKTDSLPLFSVSTDSLRKDSLTRVEKKNLPREKRNLRYRSLETDSSGNYSVMNLNSFSKGKLKRFFRKSFRELRIKKVNQLVIDLRSNGGGNVNASTLLTRYISRSPFKVADSLHAKSKSLKPYTRYIKGKFFNNIELFFISSKKSDGRYHIRNMEKKMQKPKKRNHYNGDVYILINGPTFSASTLFCNAVKGQPGILLMGEETGGGWYGNNGIMIPDIKLPNTGTRVRLPLFRLVQYNHVAQKGTGIKPDIYIPTSYPFLLKGQDKKMQVVKELIKTRIKQQASAPSAVKGEK